MPPKDKKNAAAAAGAGSNPLEVTPAPEYLQWRIDLFDKLYSAYQNEVAGKPRVAIKVTLPDGRDMDGKAWETTPMDICKLLSKSLAERAVIAKVDGVLWDLVRPFEQSCRLEILDFEKDEGKMVFWHSSAHVLGEACELHYGCHLCIGPPIEEGFYYELANTDGRPVTQNDYASLETLASRAVKEKQPFQRLVVSKENLLEMFKHNKYKMHIIQDKIPDGTSTTVYRCGPLIDLCYGPHIPDTGRIKALAVTKNSSSYWLGDAKNDSLQRIYGISFPDAKQMKEYKQFMEEAAKRDHRKIGIEQELYFFHELTPGSAFFLPSGARIYNTLVDTMRAEYRKRGFQEVITPNMYNSKLWEISGHWQKYAENMFQLEIEKEKFGLKPMNCPGHCLMFAHRDRSYRELPLRMADFGVIHRNEASGALSGLTRVRRFQQDDAHIFCTVEQIKAEMDGCLDFLTHIYGIFGFTFSLKLSTRPENYVGEIETWNLAEATLEKALNDFGHPWELNPGDGAFYGPKIDITISDALKRRHQCATIQLDFQLPERFKLNYVSDQVVEDADGKRVPVHKRPVMIHRAVLGSLERMIAILTENFAGKWPFWLSPFQVAIIPVSHASFDYAESVKKIYHDAGLFVEADLSDNTLNKKIRNAEIAHFNFIFVVGTEEENTRSVNVRNRDDPNTKSKGEVRPVDEVLVQLLDLKTRKSRDQVLRPVSELGGAGAAGGAVSVVTGSGLATGFGDLATDAGVKILDGFLENRSYIGDYFPTQADTDVFGRLKGAPDGTKFPHALRWYNHIKHHGGIKAAFPAEKAGVAPSVVAAKPASPVKPASSPAKAAAPAPAPKADEDENDIDLFGDDDEEEDAEKAALTAQRLKEYHEKKASKPKTIAKSMVILDVKPWDDETGMYS
ncbi:threonyl-tRNA synthetase [Blyttiomyces sp. JEL0837]|nr:threonyl-tRNA synthetase [Blyttiomyces sp. JEL0837]